MACNKVAEYILVPNRAPEHIEDPSDEITCDWDELGQEWSSGDCWVELRVCAEHRARCCW